MNRLRFGVLEKNARFGQVLVDDLLAAGVAAELHDDADRLLDLLRSSPPSMLVLGAARREPWPGGDAALQALRQIRALSRIPCVVLDDRVDPESSVGFLEAGADDLMPRSMPLPTMLARMRAVLRRGAWGPAGAPLRATGPAEPIVRTPEAPAWRLLRGRRELCRPDGTECRLTTAEFDLFCLLTDHAPTPVTRETISRAVFRRRWYAEDRTVDNLVVRLRRKLDDPARTTVRTVQGQGYAFTGFAGVPLLHL